MRVSLNPRHLYRAEQTVNQAIYRIPFDFCFRIENYAMPEGRQRELDDIIGNGIVPAVECGERSRALASAQCRLAEKRPNEIGAIDASVVRFC